MHLENDVRPLVAPGTPLDGLAGSPEAIRALAEPLRTVVVEAYRSAFAETFLAMVALIACSGLAASLMLDPARAARPPSGDPNDSPGARKRKAASTQGTRRLRSIRSERSD